MKLRKLEREYSGSSVKLVSSYVLAISFCKIVNYEEDYKVICIIPVTLKLNCIKHTRKVTSICC